MIKNLAGGAVINYAPAFPADAAAYDGALFYKSTGSDQGLYIFSFNQDVNLGSIGEQVAQAWNPIVTVASFVNKTGDTMTGPLTINGVNTGTAYGSGEETLTLNNTASAVNARSGAIRWTYGGSPNISAQLDMIQGSGNSKGTLVFSTRGATGVLAERVRIDENGLSIGGSTFWHGGNDGAGSGLDADLLDGQDGGFYRNAGNLNAGTLAEARLPFQPVQQGGGAGQGTNKLYIGWISAGSQLGLQVDSTNFGSTWPININGNAATANSANSATNATNATDATSARFLRQNGAAGGVNMQFHWTGQAGTPTWVWGGSDGVNHYVYSPANFSVNYATTAGVANSVAWTNVSGRPDPLTRAIDVWQTSVDGYNRLYFGNATRSYYSSNNGHEFRRQDDTALLVIDNSGNCVATGDVTAFSDRRLKKDIAPIVGALAKVHALAGVNYTRIDNEERGTGLIAQDVLAVLPEAVKADPDGVLSLAYGNLAGLLVEAIKELSEEIRRLKLQNKSLRGAVRRVEKE